MLGSNRKTTFSLLREKDKSEITVGVYAENTPGRTPSKSASSSEQPLTGIASVMKLSRPQTRNNSNKDSHANHTT